MAGEQNQLVEFLTVLRRRRLQVAIPALLVTAVGVSLAVIWPKQYLFRTRIEITETRIEPDRRLQNPSETAARREAPSVNEHIQQFKRVQDVIQRDLTLWPDYVQAEDKGVFVQKVIESLSATTTSNDKKSGTIFVDIRYKDADQKRAVKFLSELGYSWLEAVNDQDRETLTVERDAALEILEGLSSAKAEVNDRFYDLCKELGQDPSQLLSGSERMRADPKDWTFSTLDQQRTALAEILTELARVQGEADLARKRYELEPKEVEEPQQVAAVNLDAEILKRRAALDKMQEDLDRYRPGGRYYEKQRRQMDLMEAEIARLEASQEPESLSWHTVPNPKKGEYEAEVKELDFEVASLERQRDYLEGQVKQLEEEARALNEKKRELESLRNDVAEAQVAYNEQRRKWQEKVNALANLDSTPTPWKVVQPPMLAAASVTPNPWLISGFSVFAGLALGLGLVVLAEYAKSSYRNVSDLAAVMSVPVLGAIETIVTRRERRRRQTSRALAGLSTALIVGSIGWITWLWYASPERLPVEVQEAIERLRSALK